MITCLTVSYIGRFNYTSILATCYFELSSLLIIMFLTKALIIEKFSYFVEKLFGQNSSYLNKSPKKKTNFFSQNTNALIAYCKFRLLYRNRCLSLLFTLFIGSIYLEGKGRIIKTNWSKTFYFYLLFENKCLILINTA